MTKYQPLFLMKRHMLAVIKDKTIHSLMKRHMQAVINDKVPYTLSNDTPHPNGLHSATAIRHSANNAAFIITQIRE